jgi:hypothetical protein
MSAHAHFLRRVILPLEILDLCVYNKEGAARLDSATDPPEGLWPAWVSRHRILRNRLTGLTKVLTDPRMNGVKDDKLRGDIRLAQAIAHYRVPAALVPAVDGSTVSFPIKRVGRLLAPYSRALLSDFASHGARADFDRDFSGPDAA